MRRIKRMQIEFKLKKRAARKARKEQLRLHKNRNKLRKCDGWEGPCSSNKAVQYRMNTQYHEDSRNYRNLCPDCILMCDAHWDIMWKEYYSMVT